jgi:ABC-type multidrug transport system fused ATPase/permease subunit
MKKTDALPASIDHKLWVRRSPDPKLVIDSIQPEAVEPTRYAGRFYCKTKEDCEDQSDPRMLTHNGSGFSGTEGRQLVQFKDVSFHFGEKMVFNNLDFEIRSGERLVLLGPSGTGKSTLLRLLLKTLQPESGAILFDAVDIAHLTRNQLNQLRTRIGMVFQSSALISSLSVFENLAISFRELTHKSEQEIAAIVEEKLRFVDRGSTDTTVDPKRSSFQSSCAELPGLPADCSERKEAVSSLIPGIVAAMLAAYENWHCG